MPFRAVSTGSSEPANRRVGMYRSISERAAQTTGRRQSDLIAFEYRIRRVASESEAT